MRPMREFTNVSFGLDFTCLFLSLYAVLVQVTTLALALLVLCSLLTGVLIKVLCQRLVTMIATVELLRWHKWWRCSFMHYFLTCDLWLRDHEGSFYRAWGSAFTSTPALLIRPMWQTRAPSLVRRPEKDTTSLIGLVGNRTTKSSPIVETLTS